MLLGISGGSEPGKKVRLKFNQYMDATTLANTGFTITPAITNLQIEDDGTDQTQLLVYGDYQLNTTYTFTLKANATIDDCPGEEDFFAAPCVTSATFTNPSDAPIMFTTAPAIALKALSPKDNAVIVKGSTTEPVAITLQFNQEMDPTTLVPADYTISPAVALEVDSNPSNVNTGTGPTGHTDPNTMASNFENLVLEPAAGGTLAPGDYIFTLKMGAVLKDLLGNTFTNPADQVIHFTVQNPPPPSQCL